MLLDVAHLKHGTVLQGQVGIVGAGFAGLELARYLGRHGVRVVLLESGRVDFDPSTQALARVESVGKAIWEPDPEHPHSLYLDPAVRGEARIRQFGGTSNTWTGKWRIFDRLDFEERPWVPHSGWPIGFDDLSPFYDAIVRDYGLEDSFDDFERSEGVRRLRSTAAQGGLWVDCHVWQESPLRLAARDAAEFGAAENVDVVLGANATEILLAEDLEQVRSIVFRSLAGGHFELRAEHFVLAVGGLEGARLLLASNRQIPAGIGNQHDLVGRFHQNHPKHREGVLWPAGELVDSAEAGTDVFPRPGFHVNFQLSAEIQRRRSLLNHTLRLTPVYRFDVDYPDVRVAAVRKAWSERDFRALGRSALALARSPRAVEKVARKTWHRGQGGPVHHYALTMYLEQAPNPESRVYLSDQRDALGMPKLVVDWRLNSLDAESLHRTLIDLSAAFAHAGLGRLEFGRVTLDETFDAAHHIGATRMAATPDEGVVDADCRVFGTENLFIASSSVFPTGHSMGPTLTILALARRLGAHLLGSRAEQGREPASVASREP